VGVLGRPLELRSEAVRPRETGGAAAGRCQSACDFALAYRQRSQSGWTRQRHGRRRRRTTRREANTMRTFSAETYQNEYLPAGAAEVNAVVTVTATGDDGAPAAGDAAEIVIVDTSGSMKGTKLRAAQAATAAAIECIRDGVLFGVISGREDARAVYPREGALVRAADATRSDATRAVEKLEAGGGTAIGSWLVLANDLFAG